MNDCFHYTCSACNGSLERKGKLRDGYILKCPECGSSRLEVNDFRVLKNFNGYGEAYIKSLNPGKAIQLEKIFNKIFPVAQKDHSLIDVGFGSGDFIKRLKNKGWNVAGADCNNIAVNNLRSENIEAFVGELGGDMEVNKEYDIVILWDVIEHIFNIDKAMLQLNRLTKTGGKVLLITPDAGSVLDIIGKLEGLISFGHSMNILNICLNRFHLQRFSRKGIQDLFRRYGFNIESVASIRLFSLKPEVYSGSFAPGIKSWTNSLSFNILISRFLFKLTEIFDVKNKIFLVVSKK